MSTKAENLVKIDQARYDIISHVCQFLQVLPCDAMLARYMPSSCVCLPACRSYSSVVSERINADHANNAAQ